MTTPLIDKLTIAEIRKFRTMRIRKIKNGETPKPLDNSREFSKIVFHLVPIKAFAPSIIFDLSGLHKDLASLKPIYSSIRNSQYNSEGFLTYGDSLIKNQEVVGSYVQFYHNGIIEAVDLRLLRHGDIEGVAFKKGLAEALIRFLTSLQKLGVEMPVFVMLSMLKVKDFVLVTGPNSFRSHRIEKDDLLLPEVQINDFNPDPGEALKPLFNIVWNAAGLPDSSC